MKGAMTMLLVAALGPWSGRAADTVLTNCSQATLEAALLNGGRIVLTCTGTIPVHTEIPVATNTTLEATGGPVTLTGSGSNRFFTINPGVTLTLRGLTLAFGNHQGATGKDGDDLDDGDGGNPGFGGAIFNDGGTLIALQVDFATNKVVGGNGGNGANGQFLGANGRQGGRGGAATGGAILSRSGTLLLTNCLFVANETLGGTGGDGGDGSNAALNGNGGDGADGGHGMGGAIHTEGEDEVVIVDCTFSGNAAEGGPGGDAGLAGGGTTFDGELGDAGKGMGGAMSANGSSVTGLRSTFDGNSVQGADGFDGLDGFASRAGMDGGAGGAGLGGALRIENGIAAFTNSTFFENAAIGGTGGAGGVGGGIGFGGDGGDGGNGGSAIGGCAYVGSSSAATFVHCTFSSGSVAGGVGGVGGAAGADTANRGSGGSVGRMGGANLGVEERLVDLHFTVLAYGEGASNATGSVNDGGYNVSSDLTPSLVHQASANAVDPLLGMLANHGGATSTLALSPASPARDRGGDVFLVDTDQRGYQRLNSPDAGSFEYDGLASLMISANGDMVIISWPVSNPPLTLESTVSLLSTAWQTVGGAVQTGSVMTVTNTLAGSTRFYRLTD
jgi:hypothetical protein